MHTLAGTFCADHFHKPARKVMAGMDQADVTGCYSLTKHDIKMLKDSAKAGMW